MVLISLIGVPFAGIKLGLDFTGGTLMEFKLPKDVTAEKLKQAFTDSTKIINDTLAAPLKAKTTPVTQQAASANDSNNSQLSSAEEKTDLSDARLIPTDSGFIVKTRHISTSAHDILMSELKKKFPLIEETRFTTVGPTVGASMQYRAILAVIFASMMIILYIAFAFRKVPKFIGKWRFGTTAVIALLHDLIIMLGVYIYMGAVFGVEIDALFITAMLTILGFSVHDTIVVFDRIREKLRFQKRDESFEEVANQAVNETIARSINTSFSVFLSLFALAMFGAENVKFFVISLMVGVVIGTFSSIFVATPLLVDWHNYSRNQKK
jgi:preprotein translocase subunit SecF